jgi:hypothetical protein
MPKKRIAIMTSVVMTGRLMKSVVTPPPLIGESPTSTAFSASSVAMNQSRIQ